MIIGEFGKKLIAAFISLLLCTSMLCILDLSFGIIEVVRGEVLYVNTTGSNGAYMKIQDAIDNASDGDTVFVYGGIYYEILLIDKTINLTGEGWETTIIDSQGYGNVVEITANWVNMTGFTVNHSVVYAGVRLDSVQNCKISNINSSANNYGFFVYNSDNNNISNSRISFNNEYGIFLSLSDGNTIIENNISKNYYCGIFLSQSHDNVVESNDFSSADSLGIYLRNSYRNELVCNNVSNNYRGVDISGSNNNNISGNIAINTTYGFYIGGSRENSIVENIALKNKYGFYLYNSFDETITGNIMTDNDYGIHLYLSTNIHIESNTMSGDGIYIKGNSESTMNSHYIDTSNTVNGKPVYYWKFVTDSQIPSDAGQVILVNCERVSVENLEISNTCAAIQLAYSIENKVNNSTITNNSYGLFIYKSEYNIIENNNISHNFESCYFYGSDDNNMRNNSFWNNYLAIQLGSSKRNIIFGNNVSYNEYGISLFFCSSNNISSNNITNNHCGLYIHEARDNYIFHNKIINNTDQVSKDYDSEFWDMDYPIGGNFWSDYVGEDLYKGPNQDQPGSDGVGDTPYVINSYNQDNYPLMESYTYIPLENFTILNQGWNLISIPLIQQNHNLQKVLEMIDGYYDAVQYYKPNDSDDSWKHHKAGKPFGNDLSELNETMGFWIHITHPGETIFLYNSTQPTSNQTIQLYKGWNMVGYPSQSSYNTTTGLNNLDFDLDVDAIQWFNSTSKTWYFMGPEDNFMMGKGYWIHAKSDCTWEVPL